MYESYEPYLYGGDIRSRISSSVARLLFRMGVESLLALCTLGGRAALFFGSLVLDDNTAMLLRPLIVLFLRCSKEHLALGRTSCKFKSICVLVKLG